MTCNLGTNERAIRFAIGVSLFVGASLLELPDWIRGALYLVSGVALLTGTIAFCPAWKLFGIDTCAKT
jgi:Protein of unknown function (DUF2892)